MTLIYIMCKDNTDVRFKNCHATDSPFFEGINCNLDEHITRSSNYDGTGRIPASVFVVSMSIACASNDCDRRLD